MPPFPATALDCRPVTFFRALLTDLRDQIRVLARHCHRSPAEQAQANRLRRLTPAKAVAELPRCERGVLWAIGGAMDGRADGEVLPAVAHAFDLINQLPTNRRVPAVEMLVAAAVPRGAAAADLLARTLPGLTPPQAARVAVGLGLLGGPPALLLDLADTLVARKTSRVEALGPIWALHDLGDARLLGPLRTLFDQGERAPEVLALLARWGDEDDISRVAGYALRPPSEAEGLSAGLALVPLWQRLGVTPFRLALPEGAAAPLEAWFKKLPATAVVEHFTLPYHGVAPGGPSALWRPCRMEDERMCFGLRMTVSLWTPPEAPVQGTC